MERKLPVESWALEEGLAMEERGERLRIFDVNHENAPTLAQIALKLTDTNENPKDSVNVVHWISDGIKAQNEQWVHFIIFLSSSVKKSQIKASIGNQQVASETH